ncbi:hypothetical protein EGW08_021689, partial [Elysia chlorotica]
QLSVASDAERRHSVRSTWGSVAKTQTWPHAFINAGFQLLFVLARPTATVKRDRAGSGDLEWRQVEQEAATHGDILFIDMQDSYFNLTLKLMSALQWVSYHCATVKFVLK